MGKSRSKFEDAGPIFCGDKFCRERLAFRWHVPKDFVISEEPADGGIGFNSFGSASLMVFEREVGFNR